MIQRKKSKKISPKARKAPQGSAKQGERKKKIAARRPAASERGPRPMQAYASFGLWAADQSAAHRRMITALRKLICECAPDLKEIVKWGNGCFVAEATPVVYLHAEPDHLQLGFFAGASLDDPRGLLEGQGKFVRHIKLLKASDIKAADFSRLIRQAAVRAKSE